MRLRYQPSAKHKARLAGTSEEAVATQAGQVGTYFQQDVSVPAEQLLSGMSALHPDHDKVIACTFMDYNMPYRGTDSSYSNKHTCDDDPTTTDTCDDYPPEVVASVPKMKDQCAKAIEFMGKAEHGFFIMMEQGDIDWELHANHMDNLLGTLLDLNDCVEVFKDWIANNGGYEKTALYVTADHDLFLNLESNFPETLANKIIDGMSHQMTPAAHVATPTGLWPDDMVATHQWTDMMIADVSHFWGLRTQANWNSHTNMPVPLYASGDEGCINEQRGRGMVVTGKTVEGNPKYVDLVHLHECMRKHLFNY